MGETLKCCPWWSWASLCFDVLCWGSQFDANVRNKEERRMVAQIELICHWAIMVLPVKMVGDDKWWGSPTFLPIFYPYSTLFLAIVWAQWIETGRNSIRRTVQLVCCRLLTTKLDSRRKPRRRKPREMYGKGFGSIERPVVFVVQRWLWRRPMVPLPKRFSSDKCRKEKDELCHAREARESSSVRVDMVIDAGRLFSTK